MAEYSHIQLSLKADRINSYGADKHMAYFSGLFYVVSIVLINTTMYTLCRQLNIKSRWL